MSTYTGPTLADLLRQGATLDEVTRMNREGRITDAVFVAYCHEWQSSAPRFEIQACRCAACLADNAPIR